MGGLIHRRTFRSSQHVIPGLAVPPPPQMRQLLDAIAGNQKAMDEFASMFAGTLPVPVFFNPAHIGSLVGADTELPP